MSFLSIFSGPRIEMGCLLTRNNQIVGYYKCTVICMESDKIIEGFSIVRHYNLCLIITSTLFKWSNLLHINFVSSQSMKTFEIESTLSFSNVRCTNLTLWSKIIKQQAWGQFKIHTTVREMHTKQQTNRFENSHLQNAICYIFLVAVFVLSTRRYYSFSVTAHNSLVPHWH